MSDAHDAHARSAEARLGQTLEGRYRLESLLGSGGLGVVYRATHLGLDRPVAIKVLHAEAHASPDHRQRFARELTTLSQLAHPHIVSVTDSGVLADGAGFLVMELLEGESLEARLERGALPPTEAVGVCRQLRLGLAEAHRKGILHRDIKPANVLLQPLADGNVHVKLLDFGLAKGQRELGAASDASATLTRAGTFVGTPTYMAPEQAVGPATQESDLYSVGVVLFHMLAGRPPFQNEDKGRVVRMHLGADVPAIETLAPALGPSPELRALVYRSLEKRPQARFASAADMLAALDALPEPVARGTGPGAAPPIVGTESTVSVGSSAILQADALPPPLPRRADPARPRRPVLPIFALAAALAVALALWGLWPRGSGRPAPAAPERPAAVGGPRPSAPARPEPAAEEVADGAANPFDASPLPEELRAARRQTLKGRSLGDAEVRALARYQRAHQDDPRPSLILARHHRLKREWRQSVQRYAAAYRIDPSATGFSTMLSDLVRAAREPEAAAAAAELVARAFGRGALPEVERALASRPSSSERARLARLRSRLASAP